MPSSERHCAGPRLAHLRERALHCLCRVYQPSLPLGLLSRRLGFADDVAGCDKFLRSLGTVPARASGSSDPEIETRSALRTLGERAAARRAELEQEAAGGAAPHERHGVAVGPAVPFEYLDGAAW